MITYTVINSVITIRKQIKININTYVYDHL